MINYNIITYGEALRNRKQLAIDLEQLNGQKISAECNNDCFYAYNILASERKYIMKGNAQIHDYERGVCYTIYNTTDEIIDDLLARFPDYSIYFEVRQPKAVTTEQTPVSYANTSRKAVTKARR